MGSFSENGKKANAAPAFKIKEARAKELLPNFFTAGFRLKVKV